MASTFRSYTALDIAKWFINATDRESGDAITHLKLQKLLYYAQGWALVQLERPLFDEDFEAWAHGPVVPSVYQHFRDKGYQALEPQRITRKLPKDITSLLDSILESHGIYSAKQLEKMTHGEAPWRAARGDLAPEARCTNIITKEEMARYFKELSQTDGKA